jgi:hypothetical protein
MIRGKVPRWLKALLPRISVEIEELRELRAELEQVVDRHLKEARLNADDEYWRKPEVIDGLTCGLTERDKNS